MARPADRACESSVELQAAVRQPATAAGLFWRLHWQAVSVGLQPAAEMAETRQGVCCVFVLVEDPL
jgi:hypothetical protein